jgi:hypothetical protein
MPIKPASITRACSQPGEIDRHPKDKHLLKAGLLVFLELGPVIPRTFPPAPGWSPGGHRIKAPLQYARGPDKTWIYGGLRVANRQAITMCAPSRNSTSYQDFVAQAEQANPEGTIWVITDNLSSHDSKSTRGLAGRPSPHPPRLHPQGRMLAEPARRLVADLPAPGAGRAGIRRPRRDRPRHPGGQRPSSTPAPGPGSGDGPSPSRAPTAGALYTAFKERSTSTRPDWTCMPGHRCCRHTSATSTRSPPTGTCHYHYAVEYAPTLGGVVDDALDLAAVKVEFAGYGALAVTSLVPGSDRLLHAWCVRERRWHVVFGD